MWASVGSLHRRGRLRGHDSLPRRPGRVDEEAAKLTTTIGLAHASTAIQLICQECRCHLHARYLRCMRLLFIGLSWRRLYGDEDPGDESQ